MRQDSLKPHSEMYKDVFPNTSRLVLRQDTPAIIDSNMPPLEIGEFILRCSKSRTFKAERMLDETTASELNSIFTALKLGAKVTNREINKVNSFGLEDECIDEDHVTKELDISSFANKTFIDALMNREVVAGVSSIMEPEVISLPKCNHKNLVINLHPMDGTRQFDVNISTGTIFSIYKRKSALHTDVQIDDFLQPGENQLCAGYVIYGCSTMLVCTLGDGVHGFTMDPSLGTFYLSHENIRIPPGGMEKGSNIYSINGGKTRRFPEGVKAYIQHAQKNLYPCRYIGSMVADFHRNMLKGGIFIYPPTFTDPKPTVSMLFQCSPLAFLAEQAGGKASDGFTRIMEIEPASINDRVCFLGGSINMVQKAQYFMAKNKIRDDWRAYK